MIAVLVPVDFPVPPSLWERCAVIHYPSVAGLVAALAMPHDGVVIVTDGLPETALGEVAEAIRVAAKPAIEVRSGRWDGDTSSPVSATCRGVIAGFGPNALLAAAKLLVG